MLESFDYTKYRLVNEHTPVNEQLTAHYKKSYAFYTMSVRVPTILNQLIREKDTIIERYGNLSREELKNCIGEISKLKYELQTDKKMTEIPGDETGDEYEWNRLLKEIEPNNSYFSSIWLYAECYVYRRLKSIFDETKSLRDFDYFENFKKVELKNSMAAIERVIKSVNEFNASEAGGNPEEVGVFFRKLLKVNLWGNRNDLSVTLGKEIDQSNGSPMDDVEKFNEDLLIDQTLDIWNCLKVEKSHKVVDFINDNSGLEILCDLVLADFIITHKLAEKIRFRVKAIPWFLSDVLPADFRYTIAELKAHDLPLLKEAGNKFESYMNSGKFELVEPSDHFFTSPYEYNRMEREAPQLYRSIAEAHLAIFKGDLNYRKLLSDINYSPISDFRVCLAGFEPTNLCTLRTVKADLICGLKPGQSEDLYDIDENWMATGKYGVIQFINKRIYTQ